MNDYEKKRAGARLRQFIAQNFINIADFAQFSGRNPCTVTTWLNGRTMIPRAILEKLLCVMCKDDIPLSIFRPDIYK